MKLFPIILICGSVLVPPTFAADAPSGQAMSVGSAAEKKICRRETVTGSFMPKRTCHTRAEWEAIEQNANAEKDRAGTRSLSGNWRSN